MTELFDKKFVHFMWDDELEGKEGVVADDICELTNCVNDGDLHYTKVRKSLSPAFPFKNINNNDWLFFYYDPNYEYKRAYAEGKQIQFKNIIGNWENDDCPKWRDDIEYRIKPEATKELQEKLNDSNRSWNDLVEENKKLKKENEDLEWQLNEVATDNDYYKGENKRLEQGNELLKGRVKEFENQILGLQKAMEWAKSYSVQWHDLRKNPEDLPPMIKDERKISDTVWLHIHNWGTEEAYYDYRKCSWIVRCRIVDLDVIAWCEIPVFGE